MAELKKIIVDGVEYTLPEGGGGGVSSVFEDVGALPENPSDDIIYRLLKVFGIINQYIQTNPTVHIVDTLPTIGDVCTNDGSNLTTMYYNRSDNNVYGYVNDMIGSAFGIAAGWYNAGMLLGVADMSYGGVVDSIVGLEENTYYFVREYDLYVYKGKWIKLDNDIVFQGEGGSSVVMNNLENVASGEKSVAEGNDTTASGDWSHAEGNDTTASGSGSHAEGSGTTASNISSHAEGHYTTASGSGSHAEGCDTTAIGDWSHAEGYSTITSGSSSHAEGSHTTASGISSHAEGENTTASGWYSHAEGYGYIYNDTLTFTRTSTQYQYTCDSSFSPGIVFTDKNGTYTKITTVSGTESPYTYTFNKDFVTTEGETVDLYKVVGVALGERSHAEGSHTTASGISSHAEGSQTKASGSSSHAEGSYTTASGYASHAEGENTTASGGRSHTEGHYTTASGGYSHAEGSYTLASGEYSHAEGSHTIASGNNSHVEGSHTTAAGEYQHVQGKYSITDTENKYAHIVGNGSSSKHSNAHTLDWDGNAWFAGKVRVGGTSWDDATELGGGGDNESIMYTIKDSYLVLMYLLGCCSSLGHENGKPFAEAIIDLSNTDDNSTKIKEEAESILQAISNNSVLFINAIVTNTDTNEESSIIFKVEAISPDGFSLSSINSTLVYGCFSIGTIQYIKDTNTLKMRDVLVDAGLHSVYNMNTIDGKQIQEKLVSGTSIKTINGETLLGSGDITITGSGGDVDLSNYYTKTEANSSTNNSIDAAKLGGVSASSYIRDNSPSLETPFTFLNGVIIGAAGGLTVQGKLYTRESTNATTYGPGQNGQVLMSNGVSPYWGNVSFTGGEVGTLDIKSEYAIAKGGSISGGNGALVIAAGATGYTSDLMISADAVSIETTNNQLQIKDNNNNIGLQFDESGLTVDSIRVNQIFSSELEDIKQTISNLQTQINSILSTPTYWDGTYEESDE